MQDARLWERIPRPPTRQRQRQWQRQNPLTYCGVIYMIHDGTRISWPPTMSSTIAKERCIRRRIPTRKSAVEMQLRDSVSLTSECVQNAWSSASTESHPNLATTDARVALTSQQKAYDTRFSCDNRRWGANSPTGIDPSSSQRSVSIDAN
jgi:hypothetical protein